MKDKTDDFWDQDIPWIGIKKGDFVLLFFTMGILSVGFVFGWIIGMLSK